jgi:NAD-dependent deacetylase
MRDAVAAIDFSSCAAEKATMSDEDTSGSPQGRAIEAVARELADADHAVALTGAGVSTASGIPDFRSEGGIWNRFDQRDFHYSRFKAEPAAFWADRIEMHEAAFGGDIEPNAAHRALADLEQAGVLDAVITQNTDGLHAAAGSESVVELHGTGTRVVCEGCGRRVDAASVHERVRDGERPPRCADCDGVLKPDVVLFGEELPVGALQTAQNHARDADVFLAVGSSLQVQPAASLPRVAARVGTLVVVNLEETPVSAVADYDLRADVTDALPAVVEAL